MDDFTRFSACLLCLMTADLATRSGDKAEAACAAVRDGLRRTLRGRGFEPSSSYRRLEIEDYTYLRDHIQQGGLEDSLALLVELCAVQPWAEVKGQPSLDARTREAFLARLSLDLPGESDENDADYVEDALKEGRKLAGWSTARLVLVVGGGALAIVATGGAAAFFLVGPAALAAGGAAAVAAVAAAASAEVAVAIAATVLGGVGGVFGATVLSSDMSPEAVDVAVVKRFALVRVLRRYPELEQAANDRVAELVSIRDQLAPSLEAEKSTDVKKALKHKLTSFERAIERLRADEQH